MQPARLVKRYSRATKSRDVQPHRGRIARRELDCEWTLARFYPSFPFIPRIRRALLGRPVVKPQLTVRRAAFAPRDSSSRVLISSSAIPKSPAQGVHWVRWTGALRDGQMLNLPLWPLWFGRKWDFRFDGSAAGNRPPHPIRESIWQFFSWPGPKSNRKLHSWSIVIFSLSLSLSFSLSHDFASGNFPDNLREWFLANRIARIDHARYRFSLVTSRRSRDLVKRNRRSVWARDDTVSYLSVRESELNGRNAAVPGMTQPLLRFIKNCARAWTRPSSAV